ncbi:hypothetical protein HX017_17805 [Myroides marinus]|uniref:hypothetical protein n=1 Tax=Myroides marinus TaxID=703342 RepID=UPI000741B6FF|nr:hypothetical protein [Myroides marinus]KUF46032.1 hypothetical protein AS361_07955 [Myroides marinus]MDM1348836.1 hypothetical protein [Myroides marinus]MDM1352561.1 hypothetical protein [Myroides marinus]MDM1359763.1 hypothetical protein [Myroides marinus]MDM1362609.1 hypothetical protein [Myroides marinus]
MYILSKNFREFTQNIKSENNSVNEIISTVLSEDATIEKLKEYLLENVGVLEMVKNSALDYLLLYAYDTLKDDCITEKELNDFIALKKIFSIKEEEFIKYKEFEVQEILKQQFIRMYSDKFIDNQEAVTQVNLQIMFDLSYDKFEDFKKEEVIFALINGADPQNLDISTLPKGFVL